MSGPAIIPGKRFNPWRYFMNSMFINRFYVVGMWFWFTGMAMGVGLGTQNAYLLIGGLAAAALGGWPAAAWEVERGKKDDLPRRIIAQIDGAATDLTALEREIKRVVERAG